jgi:hypothetical protein
MTDTDTGQGSDAADGVADDVAALASQEGWQGQGYAARVHYQGAGDRYSVEYYHPSGCVLYWKVKGDDDVAVPVGRETVPDPLRERVRLDLDEAGIDPAVEGRVV